MGGDSEEEEEKQKGEEEMKEEKEEEEKQQQKEEEEGPAGVSLHLPASRLSTGQAETSTKQLHSELFYI